MERNRYQTRGGRVGGGGGVGANNQNFGRLSAEKELQLQLQWGSRKRLRCLKIQRNYSGTPEKPVAVHGADRRVSLPVPNRTPFSPELSRALSRALRNLEAAANAGGAVALLEKGGGSSSGSDNNTVWPKLAIQLTVKEKEEDFMTFKGSKPPQRPKKRAKLIQKTINMVTPGSWMSDLTVERYEVREKKTSKKKRGGLKAMGNTDSDSE